LKKRGLPNPEFRSATGGIFYCAEVKTPALLKQQRLRSRGNIVQLPARFDGAKEIAQNIAGEDNILLPRDNPIKDFLESSNQKFESYQRYYPEDYRLLLIVWDDYIYEPISVLLSPFKGLLTPNSFSKDAEGKCRPWACTVYCFEVGFLPSLSPEKATAIFLSMLQQQGSALAGHFNDLKDALVSTLFKYHYNPKELAVEKLQNRIHMVEEALAEPERVGDLFTKLVTALKDCHRVKIKYYVAYSGQVTERVVEPYGLICKRQNWYLVGYCLKRQAIRVFRVDQLENVIPYTNETFDYPADFNLKEHMAQSWSVINDGEACQVRLKFSPHVAFRVRNVIYHPSQVLEEELEDGSIIVSFNVCGIAEMKTWIVQWGDSVEVLEAGWLREDMCKLAKGILNVYRKKD